MNLAEQVLSTMPVPITVTGPGIECTVCCDCSKIADIGERLEGGCSIWKGSCALRLHVELEVKCLSARCTIAN